ncbi:NAD(P)/FAD-dependent oxidoreductase [Streptomyces sp. NPDC056452]|uniref:NAD(P)/FAD-dependent oxidoreductase n=1 Tax=Streptomyces sp. NPDC056452 TaxID=3345821 RepID=UPI003674530C
MQPSKPRVAVVGAGVAGISAAYALRERARITLFEANDRLGGHANTVEVQDDGRTLGIDSGFAVFNPRDYPNLCAFLEELGVEAVVHRGAFNFYDQDTGLVYGTAELGLEEEEVAARFSPEFLNIWREARRFRAEGRRDYYRRRSDVPLGEYLDRGGYSQEFRHSYMILLISAVWSVPAELVWEMPARTTIGFFVSHGEEGLGGGHVDWRTVSGGSISYVRKAVAAIGPELRTGEPVTGIRQESDHVVVTTDQGSERFDYVVVGTHADEALAMITNPSERQKHVLAAVRYNASPIVVHTDASLLPPERSRWEAWNYGKVTVDGAARTYVTYYSNMLHDFTSEKDYFVTLDYPADIDPASVIAEFRYTHPIIDNSVWEVQKDIYRLNEGTRLKLCGSYFHVKETELDKLGFHESGHVSGKEAAAQLLREL